jgi:hypothetical protein
MKPVDINFEFEEDQSAACLPILHQCADRAVKFTLRRREPYLIKRDQWD